MSNTRTTHSFHFHMARNSPLPSTLLPFLQQEYLQAALQDNGTITQSKKHCGTDKCSFTEQDTLCSHIIVKYLLFISAKARERKEQKGGRETKSQSDQDRQREGEVSRGLWRHCKTFHDNQVGGF